MTEPTLTNDLGYVDSEGRVYLGHDENATLLGQVPNSKPEDALAYFTKKYDALEASVKLNEQRVEQHGASAKDIAASVDKLKKHIDESKAFGNTEALKQRLSNVEEKISALKVQEEEQRKINLQQAIENREAIVKSFEEIAGQDPAKTQWKQSTEKINTAFDNWKIAQKTGPRIPKAQEDELWQRVKKSRNIFDKNRREFYTQQSKKNNEAKKAKRALIEKATSIQDSTDWVETTKEYKKLMDQWKSSPRVARKEDEKLWTQFRDAQQVFFDNKQKAMEEKDQELAQNVEPKLAALNEAEALLPIKDVESSRKKLKEITERFEAAGMVPRTQQRDIENRMRAVEKAHKDAEEKNWRDNDPEKAARSSAMITQLNEAIEKLEEQIASASGDEKNQLEEELATKKSWLDMLSK
ncbi:MAG: DUF349 domain-containing protein [Micrococcaceae bacterium]